VDLDTPLRTLLSPLGLDLYDVEMAAGTLNVVVDRPGGVDLDTLAAANGAISRWLDEADPIAGRYTLDVSSPGLERKLRTPAHFRGAVGTVVTLRERRDDQPTRRLEGTLVAADEHSATIDDREVGQVVVELDQVERARTVFEWGATAKPSPSKGPAKAKAKTTTSKRG
jgi:ribosome maturation factor RimP